MCLRRMTPAGISRGGEPDGSIRIAAGEGRADSLPQFRVGEHVVAGHGHGSRGEEHAPETAFGVAGFRKGRSVSDKVRAADGNIGMD